MSSLLWKHVSHEVVNWYLTVIVAGVGLLYSENVTQIALLISVTICLIILIVTVTFVYLRYVTAVSLVVGAITHNPHIIKVGIKVDNKDCR